MTDPNDPHLLDLNYAQAKAEAKTLTVADAIKVLTEALVTDEGYRLSWQANIAMFVWDEIRRQGFDDEDRRLHAACNKGADDFLRVLTWRSLKESHPQPPRASASARPQSP